MKPKKKRQHYVPKFYLRNFSFKKPNSRNKAHYVHFFDKPSESHGFDNIKNLAQEKYFYDINDNQTIENRLSKLEYDASKIIKSIIDDESVELLEIEKTKAILAVFLIIQDIRTKKMREAPKNFATKVKSKILKEYGGMGEKLAKDFEKAIKKEHNKNFHLTWFFNKPALNSFSNMLFYKKWILIVNNNEIPFWTSDTPVVRFNPFDLSPYGNLGFMSAGIQLYFPLSPKLCLCLLDPKIYRNYKKMEYVHPYYIQLNTMKSEIYQAELMDVLFQNKLHVEQCLRQLYSNSYDFGLARETINKNPKLKDIKNNMDLSILKGQNGHNDIIHLRNHSC